MADEEYNKKLESLQQYIPFLDNMIAQLKDPSKKNREQQLSKMESLHSMITDRKKKLKLETLNKCEDVITKLYQKVNHKPFPYKKDLHSPQSTPASPSPPPESKNYFSEPMTIPMERLEPKSSIPKIDIYSRAAESLRKFSNKENPQYSGKVPDLSKPPISLDDLKCLEVDVHEKINENASLRELNEIRNKIATELIFENIKCITNPNKANENIDSNDIQKNSTSKKIDNFLAETTELKIKDEKVKPLSITLKPKPAPKILKEPASIFGNVLSYIDEQIIEEKKKKEDRRNSTSKDKKPESDDKSNKLYDISGTKKFKEQLNESNLKKTDDLKKTDNDLKKTDDLKSKTNEVKTEDGSKQTPQYKRLADKYNPKPRKSVVDADVDKIVTDSIEANMKVSPPKLPIINKPEPPPPPPASLVKCAQQMDFEFQNINSPQHLTNNVPNKRPLLMTPLLSPSLLLSPRDNFISEYVREEFNTLNHRRQQFEQPHLNNNRFIPPPQNQRFNPQFTNFNQNNRDPPPPLLDYQPPPNPSHQFNVGPPLLSPEVPHFHEQKHNFMNRDMYLPKDDLRWRLEDNRPTWDRREYDSRFRGPMTYKEHRELRENSRDPRLSRDNRDRQNIRDPRDNRDFRDPRERDSRDNKERESRDNRDPRLNKVKDPKEKETKERELQEKHNRDPRLNRDVEKTKNRFESKFDRMYSTTSKDPRNETATNSKEKEVFVSPLNSLYTIKEEKKTGKGYGVQQFRIPKKKKEEKEPITESVEECDQVYNNDDNESPILIKEEDTTEDNYSNEVVSAINLDADNKEIDKEIVQEEAISAETKIVEIDNDAALKSDESKPVTEQTILAHFFSNLMSSQNKKDKKTALYSLISTFSDTFSSKELAKITEIINTNEEEVVSDEDDHPKQEEPIEEKESLKTDVVEEEKVPEQDEKVEIEEVNVSVISKRKLRSRRISSTSPVKEKINDIVNNKPEEEVTATIPEETENVNQEEVVVSVGERIKSRKRNTDKPKKKSELDKLHEDIQEMFIRDGVLTASGKRMCNILKDDPSVLNGETLPNNAEEIIKPRKKSGPKSKLKPPNEVEVKAMKNVRVIIHKIPDKATEESSVARRLTRSMTIPDADDQSSDSGKEDSEEEVTHSETEKETPLSTENQKSKTLKRKRFKSSWASGIIKRKKKKQSNIDDLPQEKSPEPEENPISDFLTPDKNYYVDFALNKSHKCKLCEFQGRYITTHYKNNHPNSEVMSSRFAPSLAAEAINDAKNNMVKYETYQSIKPGSRINYVCHFCGFNSIVVPTAFYDHLSTHTGEHRHICPNCTVSFCNGKSLKSHMINTHPGEEKPIIRKAYNTVIQFGYLCGECNYVQISRKNVEEHINIYHLEKPVIHKINLSSRFDEKIEQMYTADQEKQKIKNKEETKSTEPEPEPKQKKQTGKNKDEVPDIPTASPKTKNKLRIKPGPKSKKKLTESTTISISDKPNFARGDLELDTEKILPFRSKRAAKEKAQEKLKVIMEMGDGSPRKKITSEESKTSTETQENNSSSNNTIDEIESSQGESVISEQLSSALSQGESITSEQSSTSEETINNDAQMNNNAQMNNIKKEIDMNVFTCNTDIQEENKQIEQERLQKMEELNKEFGSRTSLNFTDKLCNRLNQNEILVKQEPKDDFVDTVHQNVRNKSPVAMPVLEKNPPTTVTEINDKQIQIKKPLFESDNSHVSTFDVAQKNDKTIIDMIEKLKGKLGADDSFKSIETESDDFGPPPLTHVNELTNIKFSDSSTKTLEVCGLLKVIKTEELTTFTCLVPPCVFSTENKDQFQLHCRQYHANGVSGRHSSLCDSCGLEINSTAEANLLENLFKHTIIQHSDFIKNTDVPKPANRMLRIRKLSGDALSVIKNCEDENDQIKIDPSNENKDIDSSNENAFETANNDKLEENPFPFKIAGVMSLAEPQPPPLAPIMKQNLPIVVKEAKLSSAEIVKPRKTQKALTKFIQDVGNLYKCPHYYCLFTTNFREFLERHLKAHNTEKDSMIPCVYCDLKTPWEHVAIHIDIRHGNCKYACSYCLYRACLKNYVFLHQDRAHAFLDYSVIALPTPKIHKKFAIADIKIDPAALCEPYKCTPACNMDFLYENEFNNHLIDCHHGFVTCGHDDCSSRVMVSKMVHHWSVAHAVSVYQCGYCKVNSNELNLMYHHLSLMHQNCNPEILVRIITPKPDAPLGYSVEAFSKIRKIATLPNITEGEKGEHPVVTQSPEPAPTKSAPTHFAQTIQVVANNPQANGPRTIFVPGTSTASSTPPKNLYLVASSSKAGQASLLKVNNASGTNASIDTTVQNMNTSQLHLSGGQQLIMSTCANTSNVPTLTSRTVSPTVTSASSIMPDKPAEIIDDKSSVEPLEHVMLSEETNPDEICESDVDPLDLGDTISSQIMNYSSEDESDSTKSKKKSGLLGYQLFRCAFCDFSCTNPTDFRKHVAKSLQCKSRDNMNKPFVCVHCKKAFRNSHILTEHIQCHGMLRYSCSLCGNKFPTSGQARSHMKIRHSINQTTQTILNPDKMSAGNEEYIIKPKLLITDSIPKETAPADFSVPAAITDNVFNPDEIGKIPIRSIFSSDLRCGICNYTTKVRTNLLRHLQFHSQEKAVSDSAPVNPVPCLEKNEKMFDKMINLASSSHKTRMGGSNKSENKEADNIPEFIPSHTRYTCCAQGCNYICPEEANLRHHLMALHDGETSFVCLHCKAQLMPTDADSLIKHLKLHGMQLYKCPYCECVHYLKNKIEKHCNDFHADMPNKVITIRHLETDADDNSSNSSTQVPLQNKINKPWRCLMCKFRCVTEDAIKAHVLEKHEIDSQFKCALCAYTTNEKNTFPDHYKDHHPNQGIDIIPSYRKLEEENKDDKEGDSFDTTPLWQRDRPRIKHIRGILFDESAPTPSKSPKKTTRTPISTKSVARNLDLAIESVATGSSTVLKDDHRDFIDKVNKLMKDVPISPIKPTNDVIVIDDDDEMVQSHSGKRKLVDESPQATKMMKMDDIIELEEEESESNMKKSFGDFGQPLNKQLKCPVCNKFKSKRISDFIFHLFKEKRVYRYKCGICADESITYRYMSKHVKEHKQEFNLNHIIMMQRNPRLELWLQMLIKSQCMKIVPSLVPTAEGTFGDTTKVLCRFCNKWFKSEPERNEHAISHWMCIPYKCTGCAFSCYTRNQMDRHYSKFHPGVEVDIIENSPTVGGELQHADFMHMKEVEEELGSPKVNETNIAEVMVPATTVLNMFDESEQDGTVQGMINTSLNIPNPLQSSFEHVDDLVIVTKTDRNVPHSGDVFCCEYCPYMSNSEPIMLSHISSQHEHMHIKFKVLNQTVCESKQDDYVACVHCHEIGSEIKIRQHHMNIHDGETFLFYRYTCNGCQKKFVKLTGLKLHSQRVHPGLPVTYTGLFNNIISIDQQKSGREKNKSSDDQTPNRNLLTVLTPAVRGWKRYQCTECSYQRDFPQQSVNNVRCHVRTHFKAFLCGECGLKFKGRSEAGTHFRKEHSDVDENIHHDKDAEESFQECMRIIHSEAMPIPDPTSVAQEPKGKVTARKSTSSRIVRPLEEFSYYGNPREEEDLNKIMTTVEINGICLDMTADKLGKIFNLNPVIAVQKCDSQDQVIEIDS